MAQYKITETVKQIITLGGTEDQVKALGGTYEKWCREWMVSNARQYDAVTALLTKMQTTTAPSTPTTTNEHIEAAYRAGSRYGVDGQIWDNA